MRILIVEDEHKIANSIKKGLTQEHYAADVSYTGSEGYDLACSETYDLILLDLMLPDMNGVDICAKLRKQNIHTPIIILTAKSQVQDKVEGLDAGADDYITKPFSFEELLARVRALVRRPKELVDTELKVSDLALNTLNYQVQREGKEIKLSSKEYSLLEYMMRNYGRVITKDELISHVWDYDADILTNTVEVYIKNLRDKIDVPFKNKKALITTVRGFGYKLGEK
jgi:two-component system, OmpR family, response regulator